MKVKVESPTQATFTWGPVDCRHQNGEITGYWVRYGEEMEGNGTVITVSGDSNGEMATISKLTEETVYTVEIAAVTSAGTGEYGSVIFETPPSEYTL